VLGRCTKPDLSYTSARNSETVSRKPPQTQIQRKDRKKEGKEEVGRMGGMRETKSWKLLRKKKISPRKKKKTRSLKPNQSTAFILTIKESQERVKLSRRRWGKRGKERERERDIERVKRPLTTTDTQKKLPKFLALISCMPRMDGHPSSLHHQAHEHLTCDPRRTHRHRRAFGGRSWCKTRKRK
jgi:hypothetical protein